MQLERVPRAVVLKKLFVIAPQYTDREALEGQKSELAALQGLPGFRRVPGRLDGLRRVFSNLPEGIIHFARHGVIRAVPGGFEEYFIRLKDHDLDVSTFRGLTPGRAERHPFLMIAVMSAALFSDAAFAADVPRTRVRGKSTQEPPPPSRPGNPFPRNPDPPLKNPLRDYNRDLNPRNDPDVQRGIQRHYREYLERQH